MAIVNLPNNEPGYIKQIVDGDLTTIYYCYPSRAHLTLSDKCWRIKRMGITLNAAGEMETTEYTYPDGSTAYDYAPSEMLDYNYFYANV